MNRSILLLAGLLLPALASAQLVSPSSPTATRGATTLSTPPPQPARPPQPVAPQPVQAPRLIATPPPAAGPIRSTGPAQVVAPPASTAPAKVYDRNGRIIPGVKPAGPSRVFDSRTGRYYDSVPQGTDSKIKP